MGSALDVADRGEDEKQHPVALSAPYYLGVYEVTQQQYQHVMGKNDSKFRGPDRPVEQVSWNDAVTFCAKLTALPAEKAAGHVYRLPTEAEWEYACRAGTITPYSAGESDDSLSNAAWFNGNTEATQPVGQKQPNAFGLFDMSGNVWEWCQDRYGPYADEQVRDPQGSLVGSERVNRGGSWINLPQVCRSARRSRFSAERSYTVLGFRVLCLPVDH
jgi:formylglycine-generating enzyme required for sulfatase activity